MQILGDFNTSVERALSEIDPDFRKYPGLVVCGTHTPDNVDYMLEEIKKTRETDLPFLGICFGHQLAAIEYARNVIGDKNATSEELVHRESLYGMTATFIVKRNPHGLNVGLIDGESYWNNFHVDSSFEGFWKKPPNFITCQYHPEYQSSKHKPHPLLVKYLEYAKNY